MTAETRKGSSRSESAESVLPLAALLRRYDRDRFQTALFAPAERREALLALYAFNYEIGRVRETVTEPMLGQIRLQWWREVVAAAFAGEPPRHHLVAVPLTQLAPLAPLAMLTLLPLLIPHSASLLVALAVLCTGHAWYREERQRGSGCEPGEKGCSRHDCYSG